MAVDGFAFYNLHLLQSDPDCRPRNPNPSSHLQNFFIVRVRHWFVQNPIWQSQRYTFYFGIDQKCWHQQLCCKGIRLPFFPRGLSVSLPIGNVPTALDCFSVVVRKQISQNLMCCFMRYCEIPASSASVCRKSRIRSSVFRIWCKRVIWICVCWQRNAEYRTPRFKPPPVGEGS